MENMSGWRRKRQQSFSTGVDEILGGKAYLCFPEDCSWFQGSFIVGADATHGLCAVRSSIDDILLETSRDYEDEVQFQLAEANRIIGSQLCIPEDEKQMEQAEVSQGTEPQMNEAEDEKQLEQAEVSKETESYSHEVEDVKPLNQTESMQNTGTQSCVVEDEKHFDLAEINEDTGAHSQVTENGFEEIDNVNKVGKKYVLKSSERLRGVNRPVIYNMTVTDHETGLSYPIPFVRGFVGSFCSLSSKEVKFMTEEVFKGDKADLMIQRYLGSRLVRQNCNIYVGHMTLFLPDRLSVKLL